MIDPSRSSVEAIQKAEKIMRAKLDRVAHIKRLCSQNRTIQTEICKKEELLAIAKFHKEFLEEVTPVRRDAMLRDNESTERKKPVDWKSGNGFEMFFYYKFTCKKYLMKGVLKLININEDQSRQTHKLQKILLSPKDFR